MDDRLPEPSHLDALRVATAALDPVLEPPADGLEIRVTDLVTHDDEDWPEVEVVWALGSIAGQLDQRLPGLPTAGSFRLPYGREWLALNGYDDPAAFADLVRQRLELAPRDVPAETPTALLDLPAAQVDAAWVGLLAELGEAGRIRVVGPGRIELDTTTNLEDAALTVTVLVTPEQWADLVARGGAEYGFWELLGAPDDDEVFWVFTGERFEGSVREQLPPVRGRALQRRIEAARAQNPDAPLGWFAYRPQPPADPGH